MCEDCQELGSSCNGTTCKTWTGCVYKVPIKKMSEFYTAHYSDGRTAWEKPLEWIYANKNGAAVSISPTIWLWKAGNIYLVDYVGNTVGCTLKVFNRLADAEAYRDNISRMSVIQFRAMLAEKEAAATVKTLKNTQQAQAAGNM